MRCTLIRNVYCTQFRIIKQTSPLPNESHLLLGERQNASNAERLFSGRWGKAIEPIDDIRNGVVWSLDVTEFQLQIAVPRIYRPFVKHIRLARVIKSIALSGDYPKRGSPKRTFEADRGIEATPTGSLQLKEMLAVISLISSLP